MAEYSVGDILRTPFPMQAREDFFECATLVLASWPVSDKNTHYLVCLLDPKDPLDSYKVRLEPSDIEGAKLSQSLFARPTYLTTLAENQIRDWFGKVGTEKLNSILDSLTDALYEPEEDDTDEEL